MNQKVRHLGKRKTDSLARKRPRKLHTSEYTNSSFKKKKLLFIPMKIQLITISSAFPYISGMNSTRSSLKKKILKKKRRKKRKRKRESENGKENEKKEEKEKEEKEKEEKMEKAVLKVLL